MVTDDGQPVHIEGTCKACGRFFDDHGWYVTVQVAMKAVDIGRPRMVRQAICPKPNERWARGPLVGDKQQDLDIDWLMEEDE